MTSTEGRYIVAPATGGTLPASGAVGRGHPVFDPVRLSHHGVHHVLEGCVTREDARAASSCDQPPGLGPAPVLHGQGEALRSGPPSQVPPSTSLRSGCPVPCGRRLHFDTSPFKSGGWNIRSIGRRSHRDDPHSLERSRRWIHGPGARGSTVDVTAARTMRASRLPRPLSPPDLGRPRAVRGGGSRLPPQGVAPTRTRARGRLPGGRGLLAVEPTGAPGIIQSATADPLPCRPRLLSAHISEPDDLDDVHESQRHRLPGRPVH
jgi:hypothetical protein